LWMYAETAQSEERLMTVWIRDRLVEQNSHSTRMTKNARRKKLQGGTEAPLEDIVRNAKMLVIVSIRKISTDIFPDYGCHMPTPMVVDRCDLLTNPDYHIAEISRCKKLLITPPTNSCQPDLMDYYNAGSKNLDKSEKISEEICVIRSKRTYGSASITSLPSECMGSFDIFDTNYP
uniref:ThiF domain-containing protein n=1 Tax=Gongylonema pulchrum TaxID=637853 RepID=A0A183D4L0_9BILA